MQTFKELMIEISKDQVKIAQANKRVEKKYIGNHGDNNYFVNDGAGNIMHQGLDEETAREYAARFPEYSIGK